MGKKITQFLNEGKLKKDEQKNKIESLAVQNCSASKDSNGVHAGWLEANPGFSASSAEDPSLSSAILQW